MKHFKMKALIATGLTLGSASAFATATANPIQDAIAAAVTSGQSNVTMTVMGLISLAALAFGVTMIVSFLRK